MPISPVTVQRLYDEQVGRPIDPALAAAIATIASVMVDGLNAVDLTGRWWLEPSVTFEADDAGAEDE
jgi:hypothetical protein